jgi:hypothetical protein
MPPVGASLLAKNVNDNAYILDIRDALAFFASKLAPTGRVGYSRADAGPKNSYRLCCSGTPKAFK